MLRRRRLLLRQERLELRQLRRQGRNLARVASCATVRGGCKTSTSRSGPRSRRSRRSTAQIAEHAARTFEGIDARRCAGGRIGWYCEECV